MPVEVRFEDHAAHLDVILENALADAAAWRASSLPMHGWVHRSRHTTRCGWTIASRAMGASDDQFVCVGTHPTTSLDSIRDALYADCTRDFHAQAAVLHGDALVDAAVLSVHASHRVGSRFVGVKSVQLQIKPAESTTPTLNYVYVESSGMCVDADGRETYFVVTEPISHHERVSCVKLYRAARRGGVDVVVLAHVQHPLLPLRAMVPWKDMNIVIPRAFSKDLLALTKEAVAYEALVLTTGPFASVWDHTSKQCHVCRKTCGGLWRRRRHHCRCCGAVVCRPCAVLLHCVNRPTTASGGAKTRGRFFAKTTSIAMQPTMTVEKFCARCYVDAKDMSRKHRSATVPVAAAPHQPSRLRTMSNDEWRRRRPSHVTSSSASATSSAIELETPSTMEWWKRCRDRLESSGAAASWVSTTVAEEHPSDVSFVSSPLKDEMAARMEVVNESIAVQCLLLSTMTNIIIATPHSCASGRGECRRIVTSADDVDID
ncbi:Aste57867_21576 [Aphanomyces stellatus]|uniref:Aste57867_21576 protein n=1 Tax=Aphanomyces stellatus TaxID=120398 RepID=A0A485LHV4_9STRA|nr:hypothetical protein As57867_021507 [Aphanomyces stellatus]VFT98246.1 Aste57867_21576 [Aphanomyces stellatus]